MIRRYHPEVRADLMQVYGVDLAVWLRARRHRSLLELIEQLPSACRLNEAKQDDPEYAELIARVRAENEDDEGPSWSPAVRDYDLTALLLREIRESIMAVYVAIVRSNGGKTKKIPELPAPVTEVDRALARIEREWTNSVLTKWGFDPDQF